MNAPDDQRKRQNEAKRHSKHLQYEAKFLSSRFNRCPMLPVLYPFNDDGSLDFRRVLGECIPRGQGRESRFITAGLASAF